ncbi:hypothetical protein SFC65_19880 [Priestia filamentosa]|uniref:hypothetical protein n=1 Tax=Priestia filamentosa TaxID=1402861 RepID=UPI003982766C
MKTRKQVLANVLDVKEESIDSRYSGDPNEHWEFIVEGDFYDVLKKEEISERLKEMFGEVISEEQLEDEYNVTNAEDLDTSDIDPDVWLGEKLDVFEGFTIYCSC